MCMASTNHQRPRLAAWQPEGTSVVRRRLRQRCGLFLAALLMALLPLPASAQSQTEGEFWPVINVHLQFPDHWRLLGFAGLKKGEDFPYQQVNAGFGLGYQWKRISKPHPENINPDKEHTFLFGAGYEY